MKIDADSIQSVEHAEAADALAPILSAPQPERWRVLQVVCVRQHQLLDVYQTKIGPVYIGAARAIIADLAADLSVERSRGKQHGRQVIGDLRTVKAARAFGDPDSLPPEMRHNSVYEVTISCRCSTATVSLNRLLTSIQAPPRSKRVPVSAVEVR